MKIILFGTGNYYLKYRTFLSDKDILCFLDNDKEKQGRSIDGHLVIAPDGISELEYDYVIIMSMHAVQIETQLLKLDVKKDKIIRCTSLIDHPDLIRSSDSLVIYNSGKTEREILSKKFKEKAILLLTHSLDRNGATNVLHTVSYILNKNGYDVIWGSPLDGEYRAQLEKEGVPVVIDPDVLIRTSVDNCWIKGFSRIFCNTLHMIPFIRQRDVNAKTIWYLHDPPFVAESFNEDYYKRIDDRNLKVLAVGPIAKRAIAKKKQDLNVDLLLYGMSDFRQKTQKRCDEIITFVTVGFIQHHKGQDVLINALKILSRNELDRIKVRIVGSGGTDFHNRIISDVEDYNLPVEFIHSVPNEEIIRILCDADVYICPSREDTMPVTVVEAMCNEMPCIVSDGAGLFQYIKDGENGFVFENENALMLSEKIKYCIANKYIFHDMGVKARMIYDKYFTLEKFEDNLMGIVSDFFGKPCN